MAPPAILPKNRYNCANFKEKQTGESGVCLHAAAGKVDHQCIATSHGISPGCAIIVLDPFRILSTRYYTNNCIQKSIDGADGSTIAHGDPNTFDMRVGNFLVHHFCAILYNSRQSPRIVWIIAHQDRHFLMRPWKNISNHHVIFPIVFVHITWQASTKFGPKVYSISSFFGSKFHLKVQLEEINTKILTPIIRCLYKYAHANEDVKS